MNQFDQVLLENTSQPLLAGAVETIQVNIGLKCNLACKHCHVESSPTRTEMMDWPTLELVLEAAKSSDCRLVDITGGAPEIHPHFRQFVETLRKEGLSVQVRTNLTILLEKNMAGLPEFFRNHQVLLVASLPCYSEENVHLQRGSGVFEKSIEAIRLLNQVGYGMEGGLPLHLVYNPVGTFLPPDQGDLEKQYKKILYEQFGIHFSQLFTITNMPIGKFHQDLKKQGKQEKYEQLLKNSFNTQTLSGLMCRNQVDIAWDGTLFDCDFNLALNLPVNGKAPNHIRDFDPKKLFGRKIVTGFHCFGCTAGSGSSCGGSLV